MQKNKKERRIDFSKEELAELSGYSKSSFDEKIQIILDKYGFRKDAFKRDGNRYNFYPPEYAQIIAIMVATLGDNPSIARRPQDKDSDDVKAFNKKVDDKILELPEEIRQIIEKQSWYTTSKKIVESIDLLVEEMVQIIYNLTAFKDGDIGQTMIWLCRELDKINYQLYRKHYIDNEQKQMSINGIEEIYDKIREEFEEKTKEEKAALFEECPELEFIFQMKEKSEYNCDNPNISIDKGLSEIVKEFMKILQMDDIREGNIVPKDFLDEKRRQALEQEHCNKSIEEVDEIERKMYYQQNRMKWEQLFQHMITTPGRMSFEVQTGREWKKITERIQEGSFKENYLDEIKGKRMQFMMTDAQMEKIMYKLPPNTLDEITKEYVKHYEKILDEQKEMKQIVKRFIGQVLISYLE